MIADIEKGEIKTVIVKDLSRLGRDHLMTGYYMEVFFPDNDVQFIAVYDNYDSENGDNDFAPFKNIINEWYACNHRVSTVRNADLTLYKQNNITELCGVVFCCSKLGCRIILQFPRGSPKSPSIIWISFH